jgi:hypothetical protein
MSDDDVELLQQLIMHGGTQALSLVPAALRKVIRERQWRDRQDRNGKPFTSFEAFVTGKLWQGLETSIDDLRVHCRKAPDVLKLILAEMDPGREHRRPTKQEETDKGDNVTFNQRGNSATYTLKRLKRDRPDLFQQAIGGQLSVNQAALEAGFRKKPPPLDELRRAWKRASEAERAAFKAEIAK